MSTNFSTRNRKLQLANSKCNHLAAQFFNAVNFVSQGNTPGYLYNLNTNNCTTFVINAAAQAGMTLPSTIGTWLDGSGNDLGDLREDLRTGNIPGMM
jgi:hypothetical protein